MSAEWETFENGTSLGQNGTEGGTILRDDEHPWGARITLESDASFAAFAITCGIYSWMMHTRFIKTRQQADADYDAIKTELARILDLVPLSDDPERDEKLTQVSDAISGFVDRFP